MRRDGMELPKGVLGAQCSFEVAAGSRLHCTSNSGNGEGGGGKVTINHHQTPFWKRKDVTGPG